MGKMRKRKTNERKFLAKNSVEKNRIKRRRKECLKVQKMNLKRRIQKKKKLLQIRRKKKRRRKSAKSTKRIRSTKSTKNKERSPVEKTKIWKRSLANGLSTA